MIMELTVLSAAFTMGAAIPQKYCCTTISPPLAWSQVPPGTKSITVICDDPDAPSGDWVHWVLFNLPPETTQLAAGQPPGESLPNGAVQGVNDYDLNGYNGPCPPPGKSHRYFFKVFALDTRLDLAATATKADIVEAMRGHILAQGHLMGTFRR
ncbi:MAG TPA: YbhB/YbcL family Raf kinase inhibitor-like protein [Kiritimatiellia bacterium]|nr:YbhB/YbcL family Raf kinase inhibitor-like protein [Kiritimatiellia bacterium]